MDFEKEEKWINEMSSKGFQLRKSNGIKYSFDKGPVNEYIYRIEYIQNPKEKVDYLAFLKEMDIEYISFVNGYAYFRKKSTEGPFEIFTDNSSKYAHINKIRSFVLIILFFNVFSLGILFYNSPSLWGFSLFPVVAITGLVVLLLKLEKKRKTILYNMKISE